MPRYYHPKHGYHVTYGAEAEEMLRSGWKLDEPKPDTIKQEPLAIEENNATIQTQPARRVGRPRKADDQNVI